MTMVSPPPPVMTQEAVVAQALNVSHDQATKLRELVREWREAAPISTGDAAKAEPAARRRCPVVTITSGKGGVGKTNIAVNLAIALSQLGARVTVLDADLGLANADLLCGITPTTRLESAIEGRPGERRGLRQLAVAGPAGVRLIPGAVGLPRIAELTAAQRESLVAQLIDVRCRGGLGAGGRNPGADVDCRRLCDGESDTAAAASGGEDGAGGESGGERPGGCGDTRADRGGGGAVFGDEAGPFGVGATG
jgi:hypothetical protein